MKQSLRHVTGYLQEAFQRQSKSIPSLPLSLLSLPVGQYKPFHQLVIPSQGDITIIDWIIVRNDCVFILAPFIEPKDPSQMTRCLHYQHNQLKTQAASLRYLLEQVDYYGAIYPALVSTTDIDTIEPRYEQIMVNINDLESYLRHFEPDFRVMKPGFAIQLLRQVEQAMRTRAYRNRLPLHKLMHLQNYYWMNDFAPEPVYSCQRDFAFTPARYPQATFIDKKEK